jgi:copper oxidase (laccase) domain-containing protein
VRAAFAGDGVLSCDGAHRIDLKAIATRRLHAAGVGTVHDSALCTMCQTDPDTGERLFFSHRADAESTGRQAGIAWLN